MTLAFNIREQTISLVRPPNRQIVVANSQNYLRASFSFSEEWAGIITAVFEHPTAGAKAVLVGSDGTCLVPWEVIQPPHFMVGVFCGNRVTSNRAQIFVQESVSLETSATADPTPTVYEQIISLLERAGAGTGGTGGLATENDPTVPSWVKSITAADIARWNDPPDPILGDYLTQANADELYQPIGEYASPGDLTGLLSKTDAQIKPIRKRAVINRQAATSRLRIACQRTGTKTRDAGRNGATYTAGENRHAHRPA